MMKNWPVWIPYPNSLLSSVALVLLTSGFFLILGLVSRIIVPLDELWVQMPPKFALLLLTALYLFPIAVIAFCHHFLHLALDRFSPDTQLPEMSKTQGFVPGLMSWWEGLYGWLAIFLSTIVLSAILAIFLPFDTLYAAFFSWDWTSHIFSLPNLVRVVVAAYLYQFEYLVRRHLMSVGAATANGDDGLKLR